MADAILLVPCDPVAISLLSTVGSVVAETQESS